MMEERNPRGDREKPDEPDRVPPPAEDPGRSGGDRDDDRSKQAPPGGERGW
jgi:hypothetical protein